MVKVKRDLKCLEYGGQNGSVQPHGTVQGELDVEYCFAYWIDEIVNPWDVIIHSNELLHQFYFYLFF